MPDHLIGVGNGVMALSRTFARCGTCTICAICVSAKRSYCPFSSRTRSHYHSHAFRSHTFQLGSERVTQKKNTSRGSGNHGDQHGVVKSACLCFRNDKRWKQFHEVIVITLTLQKSSLKYKILTITERARRRGWQEVLQTRLLYLCIYLLIYLLISYT